MSFSKGSLCAWSLCVLLLLSLFSSLYGNDSGDATNESCDANNGSCRNDRNDRNDRSDGYDLYLLRRVETAGEAVRLKDVARIANCCGACCHDSAGRHIGAKVLFQRLSMPKKVTAGQLRSSLDPPPRKIYGVASWLIPRSQLLSAADLQAILRRQLQKRYGNAPHLTDIDIQVAETAQAYLPAEGVELRFRLPPEARSLRAGQRLLPMDIFLADGGSGKMGTLLLRRQIPVGIRQRHNVAIAKHDLAAGHRLQSADYIQEERLLESEFSYAQGNLEGRRIMTTVKAGMALTRSNLQDLPAIYRGQRVNLIYQAPSVVLRCRSIAMESGYSGQQIWIEPRCLRKGSNKEGLLRARIISEDIVLLEKEPAP